MYFDNINIILFNQPERTNVTLRSIERSLLKIKNNYQINIWIDGYIGSKDENNGIVNNTNKVRRIAKQIFPSARFYKSKENLGIAKIYALAENSCINNSKSLFSLFFEDDYVVNENYFKALEILMKWAKNKNEIALVNATGLISYSLRKIFNPKEFENLYQIITPVHEFWAYAVKNDHLKERKKFIAGYLKIIKDKPYWQRSHLDIINYFRKNNINNINGTSQDYAKKAAMYNFNKIGITIPGIYLGKYLGIEGEHFNNEIYNLLKYNKLEESNFSENNYSKFLKNNYCFGTIMLIRLYEDILTMSQEKYIELKNKKNILEEEILKLKQQNFVYERKSKSIFFYLNNLLTKNLKKLINRKIKL